MAQPPPPAQRAPAAAAVTAASAGPPLCTQGSDGVSHMTCDTQPFTRTLANRPLSDATTRRRVCAPRDRLWYTAIPSLSRALFLGRCPLRRSRTSNCRAQAWPRRGANEHAIIHETRCRPPRRRAFLPRAQVRAGFAAPRCALRAASNPARWGTLHSVLLLHGSKPGAALSDGSGFLLLVSSAECPPFTCAAQPHEPRIVGGHARPATSLRTD
jgi:hypothetical protein